MDEHPIEVLLCLVPMLIEVAILAWQPQWLVFAPLWVVDERRFTLRRPRRVEGDGGGYRERGTRPAPMPELPARTDFDDFVLFAHGTVLALRRAFAVGRRGIWLVRIDVAREGDELVLRARQVFSPVTVLVVGPALGWLIADGFVGVVLGFPLLMIAVYGMQIAIATGQRRAACAQAFDLIEEELRRALEG